MLKVAPVIFRENRQLETQRLRPSARLSDSEEPRGGQGVPHDRRSGFAASCGGSGKSQKGSRTMFVGVPNPNILMPLEK